MIYHDVLYGDQEINEPWVLDVIRHPIFLRLKGVGQYGYIEPYYPEVKTTRYEHSLGVFFLLRLHGLSEKEQLAGLLHDVSHTVFSHCIDYVFDVKPELQAHQDNVHEEYIRSSLVVGVIKKHGFKIDDVVSYKNYSALELELPDICADRIDYVLRDAISFGIIDKFKAREILKKLKIIDNKWVFDDIGSVRDFSFMYKKMNNDFYSAPWAGNMHITVGSYLKHALQKKYIDKNDLYSTEKEVIFKINSYMGDSEQARLFKMMNGTDFVLDSKNYDVVVRTKSRIVDPWFMQYGEYKRFSEVDKIWQEVVRREVKPKEYYIRYVKNE